MSRRKSTRPDLRLLSDATLLERFENIVSSHHRSTAVLLAHLAEVDARRLYAQRSHSSMFGYCTNELGMTRDEAYNRITAARIAREFPELVDYVARGDIHLTAIKRLGPHLTRDNARSLFDAASGKTKEQVEQLLAHRFPKPDVLPSLRKLPRRDPKRQQVAPSTEPAGASAAAGPSPMLPAAQPPPERPATRPRIEPLSPKRYKLQLTASQALVDKLKTAQHLLKHQLPAGHIDVVLERALDELIDKLKRKRFAAGSTKPRARKPAKKRATAARPSRHVSAADKREVFERDGMRCSFVDARGRRCEERGGLELAHIEPHARGGPANAANLRLRCKAHNRLDADRDFGRSTMNRAIEQARRRRPRPVAAAAPVPERAVNPRQVDLFTEVRTP
jgi:hypothetical protein